MGYIPPSPTSYAKIYPVSSGPDATCSYCNSAYYKDSLYHRAQPGKCSQCGAPIKFPPPYTPPMF